MKVLSRWVLVVAFAIAAGCFGGKRVRGGGTNIGTGSDHDGPWSQGGGNGGETAALVPNP